MLLNGLTKRDFRIWNTHDQISLSFFFSTHGEIGTVSIQLCCLAPWHPSSHWTASTLSPLLGSSVFPCHPPVLLPARMLATPFLFLELKLCSFLPNVYYRKNNCITVSWDPTCLLCPSSFSGHTSKVGNKAWKGKAPATLWNPHTQVCTHLHVLQALKPCVNEWYGSGATGPDCFSYNSTKDVTVQAASRAARAVGAHPWALSPL